MRPPSTRPLAAPLVAGATIASLVGAAVLLPAAAADAATVAMSITVASDGRGQFTSGDGPGADSSPTNRIVRTNDSVIYSVTVNSAGGTATDETFTVTAPPATSWDSLPSPCLAAGSGISGRDLTCHVGDVTNGAKVVSVALTVDDSAENGAVIAPTGSVRAANAPDSQAVPPPPVTVSAAPRYDLSINTVVPALASASGPDGATPGYRLTYPILIDWKSATGAGDTLGHERISGPITFTDDVSHMFGKNPSPAVLLPFADKAACGRNTGEFSGAPGGRGGGSNNVVDSGTISCQQSEPGGPVSVTITGTDSTLSSVPTKGVAGGTLAGGQRNYVVSGYLSLWVPAPTGSTTVAVANTYRDLVAQSISGQTNYGADGEPLDNNSSARTVAAFSGVGGGHRYWGVTADPPSRFDASGKFSEPFVTPGQLVRPVTTVINPATSSWTDATVCQVFDNTYQSIEDSVAAYAQSSATGVTGRPQYAAFHSDDLDSLRDKSCGDSDAAWYSDPTAVPGGPAAVGMVRWTFDFPANTTISFYSSLRVADQVPNNTIVRSFASTQPGSSQAWVHDRTDSAAAIGSWSDYLTVTSNLARITSKVVDPGSDPATTPDKTQYAQRSGTVDFALYPTLTNATGDGLPETVTVVDTLPAGLSYETGSATPAPDSVTTVTGSDGKRNDVLTWVFDGVRVNSKLPTITFTAKVQQGAPDSVSNSATVSSLRDISPASLRTTQRALHVIAIGAVDVVDTAAHSGVVIGDDLVWHLTYTNGAGESFDDTDLITTLPFDGDGRDTTVHRAVLQKPVALQATEQAFYTDADPGSIDLDPGSAANLPGGATTWCAAADLGSPSCPQTLADVTGIRITRTADVHVGASVEHDLVVSSADMPDDAVVGNSFGLRVSNISLPVVSNDDQTTVHSGAIGHRVWFDANRDGLQTPGEKGAPGVTVALTGRDDLGSEVSRKTTTDKDGGYVFDRLRPGDYRLAFTGAPGPWTTPLVGDDRTIDSDADATGHSFVTLTASRSGDDVTSVSSSLHTDAGFVVDGGHPDRPEIGQPGGALGGSQPGDGSGSSVAASGPATAHRLAFTGSTVGLGVGALALAAILAGAIALIVSRRRRRDETVE